MATVITRRSFDPSGHVYMVNGQKVLSVSQLLTLGGIVDATFFNHAAAQRGTDIHALCADVDLGALNPADYAGPYAGYVTAHVNAMSAIKPEWDHVEMPFISEIYRLGGRIDRAGRVYGARAVWDLKSGAPTEAHAIQLALYAVLLSETVGLPAMEIHRYAEYVSRTGTFRIERFEDRRDFDTAYRLLATYAA